MVIQNKKFLKKTKNKTDSFFTFFANIEKRVLKKIGSTKHLTIYFLLYRFVYTVDRICEPAY